MSWSKVPERAARAFWAGRGDWAAIVLVCLLPGELLRALAATAGHGHDAGLALAAAGLAKAAGAAGVLALILSAEARERGARLPLLQAAGEAFERLWPLVRAGLRYCAGRQARRHSLFWLAVALDGREDCAALARSAELVDARPSLPLQLAGAAALFLAAAAGLRLLVGLVLPAPLAAPAEKFAVGWLAAWPLAYAVARYKDAAGLAQ